MTIQGPAACLGVIQSPQIAQSYQKFNEDILTTSYHKFFFLWGRVSARTDGSSYSLAF